MDEALFFTKMQNPNGHQSTQECETLYNLTFSKNFCNTSHPLIMGENIINLEDLKCLLNPKHLPWLNNNFPKDLNTSNLLLLSIKISLSNIHITNISNSPLLLKSRKSPRREFSPNTGIEHSRGEISEVRIYPFPKAIDQGYLRIKAKNMNPHIVNSMTDLLPHEIQMRVQEETELRMEDLTGINIEGENIYAVENNNNQPTPPPLTQEELREFFPELFICEEPKYTNEGTDQEEEQKGIEKRELDIPQTPKYILRGKQRIIEDEESENIGSAQNNIGREQKPHNNTKNNGRFWNKLKKSGDKPYKPYKSGYKSGSNSRVGNIKCSICIENIREHAEIPCHHMFCYNCIVNWSKNASFCPLCKKEFREIRRIGEDGSALCRLLVEKKKQRVPIYESDEEFIDLEDLTQNNYQFIEHICYVCEREDDEDNLLICDQCASYASHTYCDGLNTIPNGDWLCILCRGRYSQSQGDHDEIQDSDLDSDTHTHTHTAQNINLPTPHRVLPHNILQPL